MRSNLRRKIDGLYDNTEAKFRAFRSFLGARKQVKLMHGGYRCNKEYREQVRPYWKKYGLKPSKTWYRLWCAKGQKIDCRYIPDSLWYGKIVPYYSNSRFRRAFEDKNFHAVWFADCKRPQTIVMNIAGVFYDENYKIITREEALRLCCSYEGTFLIKPSIDSGEGRLISFFEQNRFTLEELNQKFRSFGANFMVQEAISQHPDLSQLNPDSINTVRVISFLFKGEVHILSSVLRIGGEHSKVDNFGAGGYASRILPDGRLNPEGVNKKMQWCTKTHTGVPFDTVRVPAYDRIIEIVKENHIRFAHFKLIGWDFGVDALGEPVFIEYNVCPGPNQFTCGPTFGELTDEVLQDVFVDKTLADSQN